MLEECCDLPLKQVLDPHVGVAFPITEGKISLKMEKCQEESELTSLAKFLPIYYTSLISFCPIIFPWLFILHQI